MTQNELELMEKMRHALQAIIDYDDKKGPSLSMAIFYARGAMEAFEALKKEAQS